MAQKKVPTKVLEHFRREFVAWVDEAHKSNHTAAAKALGMTQGGVSALYNGERGPGLTLLLTLREKTGRGFDDWLGLEPVTKDKLRAAVRAEMEDILREYRSPVMPESSRPSSVKKKGAS